MKNAIYGEAIENLRNRIDVRPASNKKDYLKWTSKPNYMSPQISTERILKYREMLKCAPDPHETKKMSKHTMKKLTFAKRYVPDWYKTQQICCKAILENFGTSKSVPHCYKNKKMCDKDVHNYPHALKFFSDCC